MGHLERRLLEAAKLGFTTIVSPAAPAGPAAAAYEKTRARLATKGVRLLPCKTVYEAIQAALGTKLRRPTSKRSKQAGSDDDGE